MKKNITETAVVQKEVDQQENKSTPDPVNEKKTSKKKKKQNSALVAASKAGSAISQADAHAYKDGAFANSGTNLTYREDQ